jgi:hypothetical protein
MKILQFRVKKDKIKDVKFLILRSQNALGMQKIQFLLQSSSTVNINTVWKLKNFKGLKMHCQNIVDESCLQKEFLKNIFVK